MATDRQKDMPSVSPGEPPHRSPMRKPRRRWAIIAFQVIGFSYIALLAALLTMESRLVFPGAYSSRALPAPTPNRQAAVRPAPVIQPWEYHTSDGTPITGRWIERPGSNRVVLYFHGNGIKVGFFDDWMHQLSTQLNANVVAAEYVGFQNESSTPTESNLIDDSLAAHDAVCERFGIQSADLILYGRSLGGACAAAVAAKRETRTLILERTFDSVADVAAGRFPIFPVKLVMRNQFDSVAWLNDFDGQLIQIHGPADRIVPLANGKRLFESVKRARKTFLEIPDLRHNDPLPSDTLDRVNQLIES